MEITLSVGLPVFNSEKIVWLAMESLCRQQDINFNWELVIAEEANENTFGIKRFAEYAARLDAVNCKRLHYITLPTWKPLGAKWKMIANDCSEASKVFILQAADCYSEPKRLATTHNYIVSENYDWVQNTKGIFFNVKTKKHILYNAQQQCGLNMATRTNFVKNISIDEIKKNVDGAIFRNIRPKNVLNIENNNYLYGVDTHGLNNISKGRENYFLDEVFPFEKTNLKIEQFLPLDITYKLYEIK